MVEGGSEGGGKGGGRRKGMRVSVEWREKQALKIYVEAIKWKIMS